MLVGFCWFCDAHVNNGLRGLARLEARVGRQRIPAPRALHGGPAGAAHKCGAEVFGEYAAPKPFRAGVIELQGPKRRRIGW